ncbi:MULTISPECIES: siderophore-interacting protein [unclassified Psychrobacter]|jgi:NADPH-dependent ferric siderophore reductase|uniref:siderophore-interacting protein n=1 Tax=unclassified Psychrobacter TaxID=196806 RepID=UPI0004126143|nr:MULTISPECIES: siderophore-interacting protein [unclassified Psychrobacter]
MAQPLAQYDIEKTPLDIADKDQFISHVNEEHQDELAMFINAWTSTTVSEYDIASIKELYTDGILMDVTTTNHDTETLANTATLSSQYFINFTTPISESMTLQEQYITLLQTSANKLGKRTIKLQEQRFTVINGYYASPNMYRLVVTAPDNTPLSHPGYAYLFELDSDGLSAQKNSSKDHSRDSDKPLQRYYTLRKVWQDSSNSSVQAWIDVYIHGDTAGGNWARALDCGVQIKTVREYPEKTEHLSEGQCLLICDETSLPTMANLLENWQNPLPPLVIAITNDPEDSSYLQTLTLSHRLRHDAHFLQDNLCHLINTPTTDITEQIMVLLKTQFARLPLKIGKVWGALEAANIKSLRQQLKSTLGLSRQDMVIKVYWRAQ